LYFNVRTNTWIFQKLLLVKIEGKIDNKLAVYNYNILANLFH
jgi:hypothetical protein